jgi:hypothetical protein
MGCTGFFLGPDLVLTAAYSVYSNKALSENLNIMVVLRCRECCCKMRTELVWVQLLIEKELRFTIN